MHGALFHLASEIDSRGHEEIGIGFSNLNFCVESADIDLSGSKWLLSEVHTSTEFCYF